MKSNKTIYNTMITNTCFFTSVLVNTSKQCIYNDNQLSIPA